MITLYGKTNCKYTAKVVDTLDMLRLSFEKKNIADPQFAEELMERGGKRQVPFVVDGDVSLYESGDIIEYLERTYGDQESGVTLPKITVHVAESENLCTSV